MKFFHVYNEQYFEGLVKNDLINKDTGFKIQHIFAMPEELKFNTIAAKGSKLHSLIQENRYPFYVDRIAGGCTYHEYPFDKTLIREYEQLLGKWFLGFQLHESASNRRQDWAKLRKRMGSDGPYDLTELKEKMVSDFAVTPAGEYLPALSHGTPEEYAPLRYSNTPEEFFREIREMFSLRQKQTEGFILPCDSYYLFTDMQDKLGMRTFMPEVGWQIPHMRMAVALARGVAQARGKLWGTYYETWIGTVEEGYSMPCYNTEPGNEWYLTQETHPDDFTTCGANGGSSRHLQKRIYYYSLMSGADYMAEEWGLNCSYSNMQTFELSEYGFAKKDFIDFTQKLRGVKAKIPFAIVLPRDYTCLEIVAPHTPDRYDVQRDIYVGCTLGPERKARNGHIEDVLKRIYYRSGEVYGNEGHTLTNSRFGDLFDILYEDMPDSVFEKYDCLIDASPEGSFAAKKGSSFRILESRDLDAMEAQLHKLEESLPCRVDGLLWLLSEDNRGRSFVSVFNNEGNTRSVKNGDVIDPRANARVKVTLTEPAELKCVKSSADAVRAETADGRDWYVDIPAAGFAIFEY